MKKLSVISAFLIYVFASVSASAQDAPVVLVRTLNCSLNPGISMVEAVEWGRNLPRDNTSANAVFFRELLHGGSNREAGDFQIAWYHGTWAQYVERMEANRGGGLAFRQLVRPADIMTCDPGSDRLINSRSVPGGDALEGNDTLMMTRVCFLNEESTYGDAWEWVNGIFNNFSDAGNTSLMQMNRRATGPFQNYNPNRRGFVIQEVGANPASFASRMDISLSTNVTAGLGSVVEGCNRPALWRTHTIYQGGQ